MVNKSGRIGRDGEHSAIKYLSDAGFAEAEREGKRAASLDVVSEDLTTPIEVKRRWPLAIPDWTRTVEGVHGDRWGLFVIQRDARKSRHPDLLMFPAGFGAHLLRLRERLEDLIAADLDPEPFQAAVLELMGDE